VTSTSPERTSDHQLLRRLVELWHTTAADTVALLRELTPEEWELPTDLPGWDVRAVASHLAHLESELAGNPQEQVEVPDAPHVKGLMGQFTEAGCLVRRAWPTEQIVDELESSVAARYAALEAEPPTDAAALGPGFAGAIGWSWQTLLSNRPLDMWMHEQDIRRATGRPGGLDSPVAGHVADVFSRSLPFVLGKMVGAAPGTTVVLEVAGHHARSLAATVGDDGRGAALPEPPADPTARVVLAFEEWIMLAGGRRTADTVQARTEGDEELARRVLDSLAVTP
jgi:uncharacterized protein (TIGR03083 family)